MEFKLEQDGDVTVARVCSESLSAHNVKDFKAKMSDLMKPHAGIVMDMSLIKFMDSSGVGALIACVNELNNLKGSLRLCNITKQVKNLFDLIRAGRFLQIFGSSEEAVRSFGSSNEVE